MPEAAWQKLVLDLAYTLGWATAHFRASLNQRGKWQTAVAGDGAGFPDIVLVRDRVLFVELKTDVGKLSADQERWRDWLLGAGAEWYCWRPSEFEAARDVLTRHAVPLQHPIKSA